MAIEITIRHTQHVEGLEAFAREEAEVLLKEFPDLEYVHIILDLEKHRHIAEVIAQARHRTRCQARVVTDNMRQSIREAADKVARQLGRVRERIHDHKSAMKILEARRQQGIEETL